MLQLGNTIFQPMKQTSKDFLGKLVSFYFNWIFWFSISAQKVSHNTDKKTVLKSYEELFIDISNTYSYQSRVPIIKIGKACHGKISLETWVFILSDKYMDSPGQGQKHFLSKSVYSTVSINSTVHFAFFGNIFPNVRYV